MKLQFKENHGSKSLAPVEIDRKSLTETGEFEGYASVFGEVDQGQDTVVAGAFSQSLMDRPADKIKMLWQHNPYELIGKWTSVQEDSRGLHVKGKLLTSIAKGREALELMREGLLDGMSIGYRTIKADWPKDDGPRKLLQVDLREISLVTFPMQESATVTLVKAGVMPTEREFEKFLMRDAGFSAQQAKSIIANGFKSIVAKRDAGTDDITTALQQLADTFRR